MTTLNVADVIQKLAAAEKKNVTVTGIDDTCNGMVIASDKSLADWLDQHRGIYNFTVGDGDPIRIRRRAVNASLTIDFEIAQSDCLKSDERRSGVSITRIDAGELPGSVTVYYIDPARNYDINAQPITHRFIKRLPARATASVGSYSEPVAATAQKALSIYIDFVISADQAITLAYDHLFRLWGQASTVEFEIRNLAIEPGDTVSFTTDSGVMLTLLVTDSTVTAKDTNIVRAITLLTSTGITLSGGQADTYSVYRSAGVYFGTSYFGTSYFGEYA